MRRIPVEAGTRTEHTVWCEIDAGALVHNARVVRARLPDRCRLIAVVKANAYGHGAVLVTRALMAVGVSTFAVGSVAEAEGLRLAGIAAPLVLIGPSAEGESQAVVAARLQPALCRPGQLDPLARAAREAGWTVPCHVEIDTGMRRHGVPIERASALIDSLRRFPGLRLAGVYTHFAGLRTHALDAMRAQLRRFEAALASLRDLGDVVRHACNTFATAALPEAHLDAVRVGGGLYGFEPPGGERFGLRPVLSLRARCADVRLVEAGDRVGYGGAFRCARPTRLALLPLGYSEGLQRDLWQGAPVVVRGRLAPIVGRISMNQTLVDVTDVPGVRVGDVFTLLGEDGGNARRSADLVGPEHSIYEVTSQLRPDLPRRLTNVPAGLSPPLAERATELHRPRAPRRSR